MIQSKLDKLKSDRRTACLALESALATKRGTKEAREDAVLRRNAAIQSKICSCCGSDDGRHIGSDGYCNECSAAIKRMLVFKSSLNYEWPKSRRLARFIDDYCSYPNLPYSLRGTASREDIITMAKHLHNIVVELEAIQKNAKRRDMDGE